MAIKPLFGLTGITLTSLTNIACVAFRYFCWTYRLPKGRQETWRAEIARLRLIPIQARQ